MSSRIRRILDGQSSNLKVIKPKSRRHLPALGMGGKKRRSGFTKPAPRGRSTLSSGQTHSQLRALARS